MGIGAGAGGGADNKRLGADIAGATVVGAITGKVAARFGGSGVNSGLIIGTVGARTGAVGAVVSAAKI